MPGRTSWTRPRPGERCLVVHTFVHSLCIGVARIVKTKTYRRRRLKDNRVVHRSAAPRRVALQSPNDLGRSSVWSALARRLRRFDPRSAAPVSLTERVCDLFRMPVAPNPAQPDELGPPRACRLRSHRPSPAPEREPGRRHRDVGADPATYGEPREQAHLPAEQPSPRQDARLPPAHAHPRRPCHPRRPPPQGPRRALGLSRREPRRAAGTSPSA